MRKKNFKYPQLHIYNGVDKMEGFEFITKEEIEDENKQPHWVYKCKHCNSTLLSANVNMLSFIQQFENQQDKLKENKK